MYTPAGCPHTRKKPVPGLLRRMRYVGGGRCDGAGSLPRLVGEDAALDSHRDGTADDTAAERIQAEDRFRPSCFMSSQR